MKKEEEGREKERDTECVKEEERDKVIERLRKNE